MASAVQPHVASLRLCTERGDAGRCAPANPCLLARLGTTAVAAGTARLNPPGPANLTSHDGAPFLTAPDVRQRDDGLLTAIIGSPWVMAGEAADALTRIDAADLLALYAESGKECIGRLRGSWAVVIADPRQGRVLLATDRLGRQPLYYSLERDAILIGSSLTRLLEFAAQVSPDPQALYHYLYFHMVPAPGAIMKSFRKLEPASMLELTPLGPHHSRHWTPRFRDSKSGTVATAQAELRAHLRTAVRRCAGVTQARKGAHAAGAKVGAFLSGGLDSSTVAGMLSELQGGSCDAYAIGFDAKGYDEMPYARLAARHFGIRLNEHYVTPAEVVEALPKVTASFDEPFGNSSALPAYFCARMAAADGIDVLLAGDGGDELFAGNTRYAKQGVFEDYRGAPHWLRSLVIEPLLQRLPVTLPVVAKGRSFVRQANTALPARLQYYGFLEQNSADDVFTAAFLEQVDRTRPQALLEKIYQLPTDASTLNRMLFLDWQVTLADNDLRKVSRACDLAGVKVRYPMLDDDLVEFSTAIPSAWKLPPNKPKDRRLRHFYKQALTGWLPDATIDKSKHGFGLPFGVWMTDYKPLQELAADNILRLKSRGIFLPRFLDQAIARHRQGNAAYYGELIWVLMSLELWLTANLPHYNGEQTL